MDKGLTYAVMVLVAGVALSACGHNRLEGTPWVWSSQWCKGRQACAPVHASPELVVAPVRAVPEQETVVLAETQESEPEPKVIQVEQSAAKKRPDAKHAKRRKH